MPNDIKIALYNGLTDRVPQHVTLSWAELVELLSDFFPEACSLMGESGLPPCSGKHCPSKDNEAWSPVDIGEARSNEDVKAVTCAVFDLDRVKNLVPILATVDGFKYIMHSTHSHSEADQCYRLVIPLSRPALPHEFPIVRQALIESLSLKADPQTKDLSRLYFRPTPRAGAPRYLSSSLEGECIDVDEALQMVGAKPIVVPTSPPVAWDLATLRDRLSEARRSKAAAGASGNGDDAKRAREQTRVLARILDGDALAETGERDGVILRATGLLAFWLPAATPWEVVLELLRPSISKMETEPEGLAHWIEIARQKYERQASAREAADVRRQVEDAQLREMTKRLSGSAAPTPADIEAAARETHGDVESGTGWEHLLIQDSKEEIKVCERNAHLIIACAPELKNTIKWNAVTKQITIFGGPLAGIPESSIAGKAAAWLQANYGFMAGEKMVGAALLSVARDNEFDPVAEYLSELAWDNEERVEFFLERYLGVDVTDPERAKYVRAVSARWFISLAARALDPGCKVDTVLILEGPQGAGKSSALEAVVGAEFFLDTALEIGSKDAMQAIASAWLVELAELASFRKAETLRVRQFLTTKIDKFRPPYGHVTESSPRRSVFAGTTNSERYLTDREGNRRYWPVTVGEIDLAGIKRDRDQLFAEAVALYLAGEEWHLTPEETALAANETEERISESSVEEALDRWWYSTPIPMRPKAFLILDAAEAALKVTPDRVDRSLRTEVGIALKKLGFKRRGKDRFYEPTDEMAIAPVRTSTRAAGNLSLVRVVNEQAPKAKA